MKLRFENTTDYYTQRIYNREGGVTDNRELTLAADTHIKIPSSELPEQMFLMGVTRKLLGVKQYVGKHCFLQVTDPGNLNLVLDSVSYGQHGGRNRDVRENNPDNLAVPIRIITKQQWHDMKMQYLFCGNGESGSGYNVLANNCCTCAVNTLQTNGIPVPYNLREANCGIGTPYPICPIQ